MSDLSFSMHWSKSWHAVKKSALFFLVIVFLDSVITTVSSSYSQANSDNIVLMSTLLDVILTVTLTIFSANKLYALLTSTEFSITKTFWDIPTYVFYELVFGLILLFSLVCFIIPGLVVFYFLCLIPLVSILLDDDEEGILKKTVRIIRTDKTTYTFLLIPFILLNLLGLAFDKFSATINANSILAFSTRYLITFLGTLCLGSLISFLITVHKPLKS